MRIIRLLPWIVLLVLTVLFVMWFKSVARADDIFTRTKTTAIENLQANRRACGCDIEVVEGSERWETNTENIRYELQYRISNGIGGDPKEPQLMKLVVLKHREKSGRWTTTIQHTKIDQSFKLRVVPAQ